MNYVSDNTLAVDINKMPIFHRQPDKMVVRHVNGRVHFYCGKAGIDLNTTVAHDIGMALVKAVSKLDPNEIIILSINKQRLELLDVVAKQVAAGLLRKADDADDWQLQNRRTTA